jgi:hypothetical protein
MANNDYVEALLEESIKAQDRTTHAVRAIASFFLIQIAYAITAGFLISIGMFASGNSGFSAFLIIAASLLVIAGFVHAFTRALIELDASKRPAFVSQLATSQEPGQTQRTQQVQPAANSAPLTNQPDRSAVHEVAARQWSMDWSDDDDANASRFLTPKQRQNWEHAGKPKLSMWIYLGRPNLEAWLTSGPFA